MPRICVNWCRSWLHGSCPSRQAMTQPGTEVAVEGFQGWYGPISHDESMEPVYLPTLLVDFYGTKCR